jgi:Zn-dependent peptidase ImmA (M78 family)
MKFDQKELREIGDLIVKARGNRPQSWLAKILETKASAISSIENGRRSVPREKVELLGKTLGIEPEKLIPTHRVVRELKNLSVSFRGLDALPKEALVELQSKYLELKKRYSTKSEKVKKTPDEVALELLEESGISEPPVNLEKICKHLRISLEESDKIDFDGCIMREKKKDFTLVLVNKNITDGRRRFTIAHEIGHLVLEHLTEIKKFNCGENGLVKNEKEREADSFASRLLMPEKWIKGILEEGIYGMETINTIASLFQVSQTAAAIRLAEISDKRCAVIMSEAGNIKWSKVSRKLGGWAKRGAKLPKKTQAYQLLIKPLETKKNPVATKSEYWFESQLHGKFKEHSNRLYEESVLTLVWET